MTATDPKHKISVEKSLGLDYSDFELVNPRNPWRFEALTLSKNLFSNVG
jgi:hypothetical protein